ncbi:MOSC domain-containing protein [Salirhabdus salicampi]|uniref:MOSC domain-containing protein n=1 Tax=Salirhabdus salicampi TaxID=476102 RepID=UPI0020C2FC1C|nr:MOSC domain-containing protein [Salirhabdus salicampi]MCP8616777.1 MOSC domain-containing protein [Salirhabdus salicampi]
MRPLLSPKKTGLSRIKPKSIETLTIENFMEDENMKATIISLNIGRPKSIANNEEKEVLSGIDKQSVHDKMLKLRKTNLEGDEQADLVNHGGVDKAVCVYPYEHYSYWEDKLGISLPIPSFGENVTLQGGTETDVHIGDIFQWGESVVQVSQPRGPCFKIGKRHGVQKFPLYIRETGYSGYYLRVLQEGSVSVNDSFILQERKTTIPILDINDITYHDQPNQPVIERLLELDELADDWKKNLHRKLDSN